MDKSNGGIANSPAHSSLAPVDAIELRPMSVAELTSHVTLIQQVMKNVMREGEHYGVIPGTGDKPSLFKPGAEKLSFTFRLRPKFDVEVVDLGDGHREYRVTCDLYSSSGTHEGQGVGSCSTLEGKYRFRWESTGKSVPPEYWESRDPALLGGSEFATRKVKGRWLIYRRVEHDNPPDYYNTCLKMAKKRAHVDATLTATAASDIFTQDVEDGGNGEQGTQGRAATAEQIKRIDELAANDIITDSERRKLAKRLEKGLTEETAAQAIVWLEQLIGEKKGEGKADLFGTPPDTKTETPAEALA